MVRSVHTSHCTHFGKSWMTGCVIRTICDKCGDEGHTDFFKTGKFCPVCFPPHEQAEFEELKQKLEEQLEFAERHTE